MRATRYFEAGKNDWFGFVGNSRLCWKGLVTGGTSRGIYGIRGRITFYPQGFFEFMGGKNPKLKDNCLECPKLFLKLLSAHMLNFQAWSPGTGRKSRQMIYPASFRCG